MPGLYRLIFSPSGATRIQRGTKGNFYVLDDGARLEVWRQPVWCCGCRTFTEGEVVSDIDESPTMRSPTAAAARGQVVRCLEICTPIVAATRALRAPAAIGESAPTTLQALSRRSAG